MQKRNSRIALASILALSMIGLLACAANDPAETVPSPVQAGTRAAPEQLREGQFGDALTRRGDDGLVMRKVFAPAPLVWEALLGAMAARKITPTILDRAAGRVGDTSIVIMRRWNNQPISHYLNCGLSMTGQRADEDRVRTNLLAQISRLKADTIAVVIHLSGVATSIQSGNSSQCQSTGRGEQEFLDDVTRMIGGPGR